MSGDEDGYSGELTIRIGADEVRVHGTLRGQFDPIDGHYHWYGRLAPDDGLTGRAARAPLEVRVVTPEGQGEAKMGDVDMWGRLRVAGIGRPPFPLPTLDEDPAERRECAVSGRTHG